MMNSSILKSILTFLIFLILIFSIYWNTLDVPFYLDDVARIQNNTSIRISNLSLNQIKNAAFGKNLSNNRPIGNITFALNYYFHKYDLVGYHILNITIHILTAFFLFLFINITCRSNSLFNKNQPSEAFSTKNIALIAALLIWLVHPLNTNSVTYIIQRVNSLASMFFLLSFLLYAKGRIAQIKFSGLKAERIEQKNQNSKNAKQKEEGTYNQETGVRNLKIKQHYLFFAGSALSWLMALGCKQTAAMLPFFILLYEWYFIQDLNKDWLQRNLKYIISTVVLFGLIAFLYLGSDPLQKMSSITDFANKEFTFTERVLTQFRVVIYYLSLFFYPHPSRLNLDHDFPLSHSLIDPFTTLLSLIVIIGVIGVAVYFAKKERVLSFCILWYFGNLAIESSIIPLAIIFEHRTYLPSMFISLIIVMLLNRYVKIRWLKIAIPCAIIVVFSVWTYQRNNTWADKIIFWTDSAAKSPGKARPHYNLGMALAEQERMDEAINHFSTALKLKPTFSKVHNSLGSVFMNLGRTDEAIQHFSEVLKLDSQNTLAYYNLGVAFAIQGKISEAVNYYSNAIRIDPGYTDALMNLGNIMANQGFMNEAIKYYNN
ncbi:MAG: tetratricopeptide repeat protein, partial [Deltaproteobacteria bacterium]|nr:tetratricopeptide repeat protein [Deltaproteobacteria bacterium]